jgi:hypothetical protein
VMKTKAKLVSSLCIGVLVDWNDGNHKDHAIKFISHRGFDRLLCDHVYFRFCLECPQYECDRRSV